jgi:hypothetical protein
MVEATPTLVSYKNETRIARTDSAPKEKISSFRGPAEEERGKYRSQEEFF